MTQHRPRGCYQPRPHHARRNAIRNLRSRSVRVSLPPLPGRQRQACEAANPGLPDKSRDGTRVASRCTRSCPSPRLQSSSAGAARNGQLPPARPQTLEADLPAVPKSGSRQHWHCLQTAASRSPSFVWVVVNGCCNCGCSFGAPRWGSETDLKAQDEMPVSGGKRVTKAGYQNTNPRCKRPAPFYPRFALRALTAVQPAPVAVQHPPSPPHLVNLQSRGKRG